MTFTPEIRRKCMQANKARNTKPELLLRQSLRSIGLSGYRLHWKIPGKPDICYPGRKIAIFVNGCFWHRCPKCNPPMPQTNVDYWSKKFERNIRRDCETISILERNEWTVSVVWECEIKQASNCVARRIASVMNSINAS